MELDTVVFDSGSVAIGRFACDVAHPRFRDSGPIRESVVVFPRTSVWIRHSGSRPFVADANVVTIYNRAQRYERFPIDASGDHCDWFSLAEPLSREVALLHSPRHADSASGPFAFERAPSNAAIFSRQRALFHRAASGRLSALEAEEEVLQLVSDVLRLAQTHAGTRAGTPAPTRAGAPWPDRSNGTSRRRELAEEARAVLAGSVRHNRSITDIARTLDTSPFHLCRVFREQTGETMHSYRVGLRLRLAIDQLSVPTTRSKRATLSQVASAVGFASHAHLVRICRRELGITPSRLRSMLHGEGAGGHEGATTAGQLDSGQHR